jgi:hypothetical protein
MEGTNMSEEKNPAAVALGRLGGKVRTSKGFGKFDLKRRAEASRKGVEAKRAKRTKTKESA